MKPRLITTVIAAALAISNAHAQELKADIPKSVVRPDSVETRIGALDSKSGMPSKDTLAKVYENLDFVHASDAFTSTYQND